MTTIGLRWLTAFVLVGLASCAQPAGPAPVNTAPPLAQSLAPLTQHLRPLLGVPAELTVPVGHSLTHRVVGTGVQIYVCTLTAGGATWTFRAPEAELFGWFSGGFSPVGHHFAGPTWEDRADGTRVVGRVLRSVPAPIPGTIPWLLLEARMTTPATGGGPGVYSLTSFIRRLYTLGGTAPTSGCDSSSVGRESRVPYAALYEFFAPN